MRILILANDFKTIANFRMELLERLISEKYEVFISIPFNEKNKEFKALGCKVIENKMTRHGINPLAELKLINEYKSLIKKIKPDVVLSYTIKPNIYGSIACRKCNVPIFNNVTGIGSTMQNNGIKQKVMFALMRFSMSKSDVIFFQNQGNMQLFAKNKITGKKSVLLPGSGVNLEKHSFVPYPENQEKIKFIIVSRLRQDKGFDELFGAIEQLNDIDNIEFHIVGWIEDKDYETKLHSIMDTCPVVYHGEKTQQEVHDLISRCHCILHPSHHEGMANVLMEASATGRPCIASDIPGCREIIENGRTGYTFKVKDQEKIVATIKKFLVLSNEERSNMGEFAREKMEKEFDRQIVVNTYLKYINEKEQ